MESNENSCPQSNAVAQTIPTATNSLRKQQDSKQKHQPHSDVDLELVLFDSPVVELKPQPHPLLTLRHSAYPLHPALVFHLNFDHEHDLRPTKNNTN